jgi:hypothetical protein
MSVGREMVLGIPINQSLEKGAIMLAVTCKLCTNLTMEVLYTKVEMNIEILMARNIPSCNIAYLEPKPTMYRVLPCLMAFLISYVNNLEPTKAEKSMGF